MCHYYYYYYYYYRLKVLHPTRHKTGHFGDVLSSQSLGVVLKKLNLTQHGNKIVSAKQENAQNAKPKQMYKTKPKPTLTCKNCSRVCISLCTTVVHNTAQNSSDNLPSYPPDNHHCSDVVYWRGGALSLLLMYWLQWYLWKHKSHKQGTSNNDTESHYHSYNTIIESIQHHEVPRCRGDWQRYHKTVHFDYFIESQDTQL